eukprot:344822-Prymnesium_polylepis.1
MPIVEPATSILAVARQRTIPEKGQYRVDVSEERHVLGCCKIHDFPDLLRERVAILWQPVLGSNRLTHCKPERLFPSPRVSGAGPGRPHRIERGKNSVCDAQRPVTCDHALVLCTPGCRANVNLIVIGVPAHLNPHRLAFRTAVKKEALDGIPVSAGLAQ